jgi:tripartite-type tricarboxylate transporter receptor subunit TctC
MTALLDLLRARLRIPAALLGLAVAGFCVPAPAQELYPNRLIHVIVPYPSGSSGADILARLLGPKIAERWKVPVIVENRPGASSVPGHDAIAKAPPNGYTIGFSATSFTANVPLIGKLPYDPIKSFERIVLLATNVVSFCIANNVPAKTLAEFLDLARRQPGKLNYASPGNGTPQHLAMELLKLEASLDIVHVPYKSSAGAITDLVGGHVQAMVIPLQTAAPHVQSGSLKMLAVMSAQRSSAFPEVPTMRELGMPAIEVDTWYGIFAPGGTPADIVAKWNAEVNALLRQPDVRESLEKQGLVPGGGSPERFTQLLKDDIARWTRVVAAAGIKAD